MTLIAKLKCPFILKSGSNPARVTTIPRDFSGKFQKPKTFPETFLTSMQSIMSSFKTLIQFV